MKHVENITTNRSAFKLWPLHPVQLAALQALCSSYFCWILFVCVLFCNKYDKSWHITQSCLKAWIELPLVQLRVVPPSARAEHKKSVTEKDLKCYTLSLPVFRQTLSMLLMLQTVDSHRRFLGQWIAGECFSTYRDQAILFHWQGASTHADAHFHYPLRKKKVSGLGKLALYRPPKPAGPELEAAVIRSSECSFHKLYW